ncbi:hypothetical protein EOD41_13660 [Mucilaginibacter limnophilus]|uniref:Uncharacterized protein n=1 Tax=Mucilaginibacter limnophilus TaxID=1932778 RepID=A0A437MQS8_9SPHI|nr:hypothetical protein [Mucilaginibacter limnophilus]RVU00007.1 hypothetical protein EOD41_13660 [Mucilaginibacter limnophilus]
MPRQLTPLLLVLFALAFTQVSAQPRSKPIPVTTQYNKFKLLAAKANVTFTTPKGFNEIPALDNEDFTFDYAMEIAGKGFEVWYMVRSQKENWASYERVFLNVKSRVANPDSVYAELGKAQAAAFTDGSDVFPRTLPPNVLSRYNADAGRSYMLNLIDMPETRHYQYALLVTLQKYHTGTVMMVCFTNQKGPEFYKNVERAGSSIKFKPEPADVDKLTD